MPSLRTRQKILLTSVFFLNLLLLTVFCFISLPHHRYCQSLSNMPQEQQQQQPCIELTIMAAEGLKNVSMFRRKMNPYAVVFVDPRCKFSTKILPKGGTDPVWNDAIRIPLQLHSISDASASLTFQIFHHSSFDTALAGTTQLLLQDLLRNAALKIHSGDEGDILTLQLFRPSGRPHGILRVFLKVSGDGLPSFNDGLFGPDVVPACPSTQPATGIPVLPLHPNSTISMYNSNVSEAPTGKFGVPYSNAANSAYVHTGYLPYPTPPQQGRSYNNNFFFGVLSGAVAAVLLGSLF